MGMKRTKRKVIGRRSGSSLWVPSHSTGSNCGERIKRLYPRDRQRELLGRFSIQVHVQMIF